MLTQKSVNEQHAEMVAALVKKGDAIMETMTPERIAMVHAAIGVSGEAGELLDAVKKVVIYNREIDMVNMIEELGDLEFYLQDLRHILGVTREQTLLANIGKLAKRYEGFKYTDAAAQARADKA